MDAPEAGEELAGRGVFGRVGDGVTAGNAEPSPSGDCPQLRIVQPAEGFCLQSERCRLLFWL